MSQRLFSNKKALDVGRQDWQTPPLLFTKLNDEFHFTVDAAADDNNHLLPRYWTEETDGLAQDWSGERVFCNPPFGLAAKFVEKATRREACVSVLILPANIQNNWWDKYALTANEVRFIKGRTWFIKNGVQTQATCGVHDTCVVMGR